MSSYGSYIDALIYVYCENDFIPTQPYGDPDAVVDWLESFTETAGIDDVTVVYALFIDHVHLSPYGIDQVADALTDN